MSLPRHYPYLNLLLALYLLLSVIDGNPPSPSSRLHLSLPEHPAHWKSLQLPASTGDAAGESLKRPGLHCQRLYVRGNNLVGVYICGEDKNGGGLHSPLNCYTASGWTILSEDRRLWRGRFHFKEVKLCRHGTKLVTWYCFFFKKRTYDNFIELSLIRLVDELLPGRQDEEAVLLRLTSYEKQGGSRALTSLMSSSGLFERLSGCSGGI